MIHSSNTPQNTVYLRQQMQVSQELAYFDHAAVAPLPRQSALVICQFAEQASRGGDVAWLDWSKRVEDLRRDSATLLGCSQDEIALVANTSTGIGMVAEGFPWRPGDNVVVPANEFPANKVPWHNLARLGVEVREFPVEPSGEVDLAALKQFINARTRIVAISWVGFVTGYRIDLVQLVEIVHRAGALVCLDAIQGLGAFSINVKQLGVDFLAADGHKWMLGTEGAGILFVDAAHLERLQPIMVGWNSLEDSFQFNPSATKLRRCAARYEGGATNMVGMMALGESVRLLLDCGTHLENGPIASSILTNVDLLHEKLTEARYCVQLPADGHRSGIMTLTWPGGDYSNARKFCLSQGVVISVRSGRIRVSTHAYNDAHDIDRLVRALNDYRKIHGK